MQPSHSLLNGRSSFSQRFILCSGVRIRSTHLSCEDLLRTSCSIPVVIYTNLSKHSPTKMMLRLFDDSMETTTLIVVSSYRWPRKFLGVNFHLICMFTKGKDEKEPSITSMRTPEHTLVHNKVIAPIRFRYVITVVDRQ